MPSRLRFKYAVEPVGRIPARMRIRDDNAAQDPEVDLEHNTRCGGLVGTYKSLCNYYDTEANVDVIWHFSHLPSRVRTFDLKKFQKSYSEHPLRMLDLGPLFWSLRFNFYFRKLCVNMKLDRESFLDAAEMCRFNCRMQHLVFREVGGTKKYVFPRVISCLSNWALKSSHFLSHSQ
jgi:hypothetical protein